MTTETGTMDKRQISELLELDTYQGMTDEEIDSIIDYYKELEFRSGERSSKAQSREEAYLQSITDNRNALMSMQVMVQSLLEYMPSMTVVPDETESGDDDGQA